MVELPPGHAPAQHSPAAFAANHAPLSVLAAATSTAATPGSVKAISASVFVASLGVNTHVSYMDTPYGNVAKVGDALLYLRTPRVRDYLAPWVTDRFSVLARRGIKLNLFLPGKMDLAAYVGGLAKFQASYPGSIVSLEGPNEVNYWPTPWPQGAAGKTDLPSQAALQLAYYDKVKATPALKDLPVSNLTLGGVGAESHRQLGDMRKAADLANVHIYFGPGDPPRTPWGYAIGLGQIPMPATPTVITETGYTSAYLNNEGVDETTQAKQTLNLLCRVAVTGIRQTYLYELVDQKPDPARKNKEANFGLFRNDWSPKPAATAIRNFLGALGAGNGPARGGALAYSVAGLPAQGAQALFQSDDGRFSVVVWAEPDIWDQTTHKAVTVPASQTVIRFSTPVASYEVFDPLRSETAIAKGGPAAEVRVAVSDHPVIVRVMPEQGR